ncbi:MAG TPA: hypothetical protein VMH35_04005 [Streptosporangiaceae bacterium]|nr:hypothetical protein [Streptosporangiaceae bacterium]
MDLTPAQRVLAFLGIVVVLGGTGAYLLIPGVRAALGQGPHGSPPPSTSARSSSRPAPAASTPAAPSSAPGSTTAVPSAPNIYAWLPFSQSDLAKAAGVTEAFGAAYDTFSYRENATSYVTPMRSLATSDLTGSLARAYSTLGVASQRARQRQVSTAKAVISSLRSYGPSSLTFVVTINQTLHTTQGTSQGSTQWAVTVVSNAGAWLVNDIEPAQAGNT